MADLIFNVSKAMAKKYGGDAHRSAVVSSYNSTTGTAEVYFPGDPDNTFSFKNVTGSSLAANDKVQVLMRNQNPSNASIVRKQ